MDGSSDSEGVEDASFEPLCMVEFDLPYTEPDSLGRIHSCHPLLECPLSVNLAQDFYYFLVLNSPSLELLTDFDPTKPQPLETRLVNEMLCIFTVLLLCPLDQRSECFFCLG